MAERGGFEPITALVRSCLLLVLVGAEMLKNQGFEAESVADAAIYGK